jgi:hypothetical protein
MLTSCAGLVPARRADALNLRLSASCRHAISTYCEAIRVCALPRRDSGRSSAVFYVILQHRFLRRRRKLIVLNL